jgi:hypothetical protein
MKRMALTAITFGIIAIISAVVTFRSTSTAQEPPVDPGSVGPEGTWNFAVRTADCTTGIPTGTPPAPQLVSYAGGGVYIVEEVNVPPSRRYAGLGVWRHLHGRTYSYALKIAVFNADGTPSGTILVVGEVEHNLDDTLTSSAAGRFYNTAGDLVFSRCTSGIGTRFTGEN